MFHQVGVHTGNILKGAKPADLAWNSFGVRALPRSRPSRAAK
jgi:hypothetical protein